MPVTVACGGCSKTFAVKDELAGKRVKCPGCGAVVAIPASSPALPVGGEALASRSSPRGEPSDEYAAKPRKKKRKRIKSDEPAAPLFTLAGIEFTPVKLMFAVPFVILMAVGGFFLFNWLGKPSAPEVQPVDVYMAINGVRNTGVGEMALQSGNLAYTIPGHRKVVVTRENPDGAFLLVRVRVKNTVADQKVGGSSGYMFMERGHIKLRGGSETVEPLYIMHLDAIGRYVDMGFNPPQEAGKGGDLHEFLGPGEGEWKTWTHDGKTSNEGGSIRFEGRSGMKVTIRTSDDRPDGREGRNVLEGLTGAKIGKGIEAGGLVAAPSDYIRVSWDDDSRGWMVGPSVERPNDLSRYWELSCIFARPKGSGKELTLIVLGEEKPLKVP